MKGTPHGPDSLVGQIVFVRTDPDTAPGGTQLVLGSRMPRLTPQRLWEILAEDPETVALYEDHQPVGIGVPLPHGMTELIDGERIRYKTALLGDRVGKDRYGHWVVMHGQQSASKGH